MPRINADGGPFAAVAVAPSAETTLRGPPASPPTIRMRTGSEGAPCEDFSIRTRTPPASSDKERTVAHASTMAVLPRTLVSCDRPDDLPVIFTS